MKKKTLITLLMMAGVLNMSAESLLSFNSPDGSLSVEMLQNNSQTYMKVTTATPSSTVSTVYLGVSTSVEDFKSNLAFVSASSPTLITDEYDNIHGKHSHVRNQANEVVAHFTNSGGATGFDIVVRAYNNGIAFRYSIPNEDNVARTFTDEYTTFEMPSSAHRWLQTYSTAYEGDFPYQSSQGSQGNWGFPALFENNSVFTLITEADVNRMYCSTHLNNESSAGKYKVTYPFSWEGNNTGDVNPSWKGKWSSPWRLMIVGSLKDIVESTLVEDVCPPNVLSDTSWIVPGSAAWVYWAYNHGTRDFQLCCQYVDLAVAMGWPYVLFDWEWDSMTNGGNLEDAVAYALSKGVKPLMWYNSGGPHNTVSSTPRDRMLTHESRVSEFTWLKSIGVAGVKIDFFDSDKQDIMNYYLDILEDAADFQIMTNFHGATLPKGWSRTYPHLMTTEAVYGAEWYNNNNYMTSNGPRINCTLPYTRNVVGPMDYTPVAFTNSQNPHTTTYAHELALSVAFESGIQHWADRPEGFYALPEMAKRHMQTVPTAWDETRFVDGYPGKSFIVARRKGDVWYVGGLQGEDKTASLKVPLSFLSSGSFTATLIADGTDATKFSFSTSTVTRETVMSVPCLGKGGFVLTISDGSAFDRSWLTSLQDAVTAAIGGDDYHIGRNSGNYDAEAVSTLQDALTQSQQINGSSSAQEAYAAYLSLLSAYSFFQENGKVAGGNLGLEGRSLTVSKLVEASNFSRSDGGSTRFGTPANWTVENFSVPQTNSNGTKNGIDNYPGYNCLMMGLWSGEDGSTSSDLTNSRIYRKITLPAGHYYFAATYNANYQLGEAAYLFASSSLLNTSQIPSQSIAYFPLNQSGTDGNYYGIEFYLDSEQEIYVGWQADLTSGSATKEFRVRNVELLDLSNAASILDAQPLPFNFTADRNSLLGETSNFADNGETTRFRSPKNWTVENYAIDNGGSGTKGGIDTYPGYNCLQLGRWEESASAYDEDIIKNSRLYKQLTLPAGTYFFGAKFHYKEGNCDDNDFMFVSTTLVNTDQIDDVLAGCRLKNSAVDGNFYGFTFTLDTEKTLYIGFQANSSVWHSEIRVQEITLRQKGDDQGLLPSPWTQQLTSVPSNPGNYFFVLKDYPQNLMLVSKSGANQGSDRKTLWYTADVNPSANKDALLSIDTDGDYQVITSVTYPDVMFQTNGAWNYHTGNNGGGDLSWGYVKLEAADGVWTAQNGHYGGANYLGPWSEVIKDGAEVALNKSGSSTGHFDLFSISRGLYISHYEDFSSAAAEHPVDITYIVSNPGAERYSGDNVCSWINGSDWLSQAPFTEGDGSAVATDDFHSFSGSRYFMYQTLSKGDAENPASDLYQTFTDMPQGFYRFSAMALGGDGLRLYANQSSVPAPTGSPSRISVIGQVKTDGLLSVGVRAYNVTGDPVMFDDVRLEYLYAEAPQTVIGSAVWNKPDGVYIQSFDNDLTITFNEASSQVPGAQFALLSATTQALLSDGMNTCYATPSLSGKTLSLSFDSFTLQPGKDYTVTLPAGVVGFKGLMANETLTLTFHTPWVFDGIYYLYNVGTQKKLAPSGNDVYVTDEGMPVSWVVNTANEGTIQFTETGQYVTGRWWAGLSSDDAKKYSLIPSEEPGLEGFKIKKTYPEDDPWYWLYVNDTRVATNGRQAANGDNFSEWKYAVWQFKTTEVPTAIIDREDWGCADLRVKNDIYTLSGQKVGSGPVPARIPRGLYIVRPNSGRLQGKKYVK